MKSWKTLLFTAFFVAVLGFILDAMLPHPRCNHQYENKSQAVVDIIATAIHVYRMQQGEVPLHEPVSHGNWMSSILQHLYAKGYIGIDSEKDSSVTIDPWGNPYNVHIRGLTIASDEFDKTFGKDVGDVVVWSIGRNEIDELGKGDDIINSSAKKSQSRNHGG
jgi:hypothetical protein